MNREQMIEKARQALVNHNEWISTDAPNGYETEIATAVVDALLPQVITPEAIERGARYLFASRYFGDEDFADEETARIYREESEGCLRAALASADEVQ